MGVLTLKKNAECESCELCFIWGKMRTAAWENNTSGSSKKLFQRGRGKGQYTGEFGEVGVHALDHFFFFCQKFS